ncbi:MAG: glycosyl hydrolase, partial [Flavobacteriaceae bacterium TMED200]
MPRKNTVLLIFILIFSFNSFSQRKKNKQKITIEKTTYNNLYWRNIGPFRGGRSVASCGLIQKDNVFYMGSTGGGVWKSEDYGISWNNISDGFFKTGTVGAISVSESDENIVVVGMGEHAARGVMTSIGDGVYMSMDSGKTWKHTGLESTYHISDVIIHPENPKIIFVSAQGSQYGPSKERGVFKTIDGGITWKKVLYVNQNVGASSITMDMNNPRIIYASMWEHSRTPWKIKSGGKNSGIYKSSDGGENWIKLKTGLPKEFGKSGISVSRANSNLVYTILEAEGSKSGLYKSVNGGKEWKLVNNKRINITRSWYYMEVFADPQDENVVYVLNAPVMKSIDGGKTFKKLETPHGDNHHLWINPKNNNIMINSNDGGVNITTDKGISWSSQKNQPTSQFYRVIADSQTPYHVYGGQQDNSAIGIKNRTYGGGISWKDWYSVAGCESAFLAFD